ncbi:hypothetical protein ES703_11972 [subsurface metagenome]
MSQKSGQIARSDNGTGWLYKDEDLPPSILRSKFAFQMKRAPKREESISKVTAQVLLGKFYLRHLEDYDRMFERVFHIDPEDYSSLSESEIDEIQERERKNNRWLDVELLENLNHLGQRISNFQELEVLCRLLRSTQRMIARRQENYEEFDAQLSFFSEPMKFLIRIEDELEPSLGIRVEFDMVQKVLVASTHFYMTPKTEFISPSRSISE